MMQPKVNRRSVESEVSNSSSIRNILDVAMHKCDLTKGVFRCVEDSDPNDDYRVFKVEDYANNKYIIKILPFSNGASSIMTLEKPLFESGEECFFDLVSDFTTPVSTGFVFNHESCEEVSDVSPQFLKNSSGLLAKALKTLHNTSSSIPKPSLDDLDKSTPESIKNALAFIMEETKTNNPKTCLFASSKNDIYLSRNGHDFSFKFLDLSSSSLHNPVLDIAIMYMLFRLDKESLEAFCVSYGDKTVTSESVLGFYDHACLLLYIKDLAEGQKRLALSRDLSKILEKSKNKKIKEHYKEINDNRDIQAK